ncbi:hypothetical protein MRB53_025562 [Persea americana]|uniref:Uncharacterized protein n=1 Tax=Persea americana TaxID=3435 RepID=A0ACC2LG73_PERAE|nr:hypothetical protein MRB53_025562 [Persea americana]
MPPTGLKEAQIRENSNQKVHPQPMEETMNQSQEAFEALIAKIFTNVSSLKAAYIQLQAAHTPYDPDKIHAADKLVIEELKNLSELKHSYRDSNPKPISASPQDSKLVTEIQEQQNLLKTYEVMVKKFQSQLQTKDSEILQLQQQIQESNQRKVKLEKKLKQRGLQAKESEDLEENSFFSMELTPSLFSSAVEAAYKAIHDFSKPLINLMKAAGWDLDAAANAIQPAVVYAKRSHQKYAFESHICQRMFAGFDEESFSVKHDDLSISKEGFFHQFLALRVMDPLDVLSQNADSIFGKFCRSKYLSVIHPKMEASFFGSLDQRNYVAGGGHPRTPFYQAFLKLAKSIWLLHRLALSFDPNITVFQVRKGTEFSEVYMESIVKNVIVGEGDRRAKVGFMVMPGFKIGGSVIQCQLNHEFFASVKVGEETMTKLKCTHKQAKNSWKMLERISLGDQWFHISAPI